MQIHKQLQMNTYTIRNTNTFAITNKYTEEERTGLRLSGNPETLLGPLLLLRLGARVRFWCEELFWPNLSEPRY